MTCEALRQNTLCHSHLTITHMYPLWPRVALGIFEGEVGEGWGEGMGEGPRDGTQKGEARTQKKGGKVGGPNSGGHNISFPSPAPIFFFSSSRVFFLLLSGGFLVEFWRSHLQNSTRRHQGPRESKKNEHGERQTKKREILSRGGQVVQGGRRSDAGRIRGGRGGGSVFPNRLQPKLTKFKIVA